MRFWLPWRRKAGKAKKLRPQDVTYTTSRYGFRYREIDADPYESFAAAQSHLLDGELLYRFTVVKGIPDDTPSPVLIENEINFIQSLEKLQSGEWGYTLAAGIPVSQPAA